jgi:hypothetical protein
MQRLYKRRRTDPTTGLIESNWGNQLGYGVYYDVRHTLKTNDAHEKEDNNDDDNDTEVIYDGGEVE